MPNIPKVKIGNVEYDLKDVVARKLLNPGDVTHALRIKESSGYIRSTDGAVVPASPSIYSYSYKIPVAPGEKYIYYLYNPSPSALKIACYASYLDANAVVAKSVIGDDSATSGIFTIPDGVWYVRLCTNNDDLPFTWRKADSKIKDSMSLNEDFTTDLNTLTVPGYYTLLAGNTDNPNFPPNATSSVGLLEVAVDSVSGIVYQTYTEMYTGKIYTRIKRAIGWDDWASINPPIVTQNKEISILFVGNSLTQDGVAYLPYLLKEYYPEISFKFYIWYNGGRTLEEQYGYFVNNTPCDIFSVAENESSWTNFDSSKTMASILSTYTFDVVCMQEYFNYKESFPNITDWNNCQSYIATHYTGGNPLEFISLFHAPRRNNLESVYALEKAGNGKILRESIAQDMLPVGIAIYNALGTSIGNLGDGGDLSPGDSTHTQEGLPCMIQTYTIACWLLDKLGMAKSVYGCPLRITTSIYNSINVPGPNIGSGLITGTDAQNLIAQEVAIRAYKEGKAFVSKNLYADAEN